VFPEVVTEGFDESLESSPMRKGHYSCARKIVKILTWLNTRTPKLGSVMYL
jgi:hypothetical protein